MEARNIGYEIGGRRFTGFLADGSDGRSVPGILVAHEGGGMTEHPRARARMLAEAGYVAFAMDTFGERPETRAQAGALIAGLMADLATLRARGSVALGLLKEQRNVDGSRLGAIGFRFGGATVLELARSGAEVQCVVGFHSVLTTSAPNDAHNIKGRVLVCLGDADPIVSAAGR